MEDLISIIIPVYNVEKYLEKCLNSVINQTYKNLEIILVDDGSTDDSGKICDKYAKKDKRIKVYHKKNGGSSDARNYGLKKVHGDYIGFIDADDYIDNNMYELLYNACIEDESDISWCDKYFELDNKKSRIQKIYIKKKKMSKQLAHQCIMLNDASLCDKLFKKEIFSNIQFVVGSLYEDIMPLAQAIENANYISYIAKPKYHYIQRNGSNVHHFDKRKLDYKKNAKLYIDLIENKYQKMEEVTDAYYILVLITLINSMYNDRKEYNHYYNNLLNELNKYSYMKNRYIPKFKKIMIFLINKKMVGIVIILKNFLNKIRYK